MLVLIFKFIAIYLYEIIFYLLNFQYNLLHPKFLYEISKKKEVYCISASEKGGERRLRAQKAQEIRSRDAHVTVEGGSVHPIDVEEGMH